MLLNEQDWAALEDALVRLATGHVRLTDLVDRQRLAIRKANPRLMSEVGVQIAALVHDLADMEGARRDVSDRLASRLGLAEPGRRVKLGALIERAPGRWPQRLRLASNQLTAQLDRVRRAGRANLDVATRLADFCGEVLGTVSRIGRDTGCYDARGRRAVAKEAIAPSCFSAVA